MVARSPGINCGWFISARKRSLQRLCFHRCLSVHEGEWVWQTPPSAGIPPWAGTPPGQAPHQAGTPWAGTPAGQVPPGRYTASSWADTSPFPGWYTPLADGQQAGGTHPTGMHSCLICRPISRHLCVHSVHGSHINRNCTLKFLKLRQKS